MSAPEWMLEQRRERRQRGRHRGRWARRTAFAALLLCGGIALADHLPAETTASIRGGDTYTVHTLPPRATTTTTTVPPCSVVKLGCRLTLGK